MHWAHHPDDAFRSGPDTNQAVLADAQRRGAAHLVHHRDEDFVLDVVEAFTIHADLLVHVRQHHLDLTLEATGRDALDDPDVRG